MKATIPLAEGMAVDVEGDPREMLDLLVAMAEAFANGTHHDSPKYFYSNTFEVRQPGPAADEEPEDLGTMGRAEEDAPPPPPPAAQAPRGQGCPECGSPSRHKATCSRSKAGTPPTPPEPKKKIGRRPSIGGVALDDHAAPPPDYSDHGDLFDLPPLVFDGPDGERVVKDKKLQAMGHAHTFKLPPWSGHEETLGRCSCGATRRYRN